MLTVADLPMMAAWIDLKREALLAYWRGEFDGADMIQASCRVR